MSGVSGEELGLYGELVKTSAILLLVVPILLLKLEANSNTDWPFLIPKAFWNSSKNLLISLSSSSSPPPFPSFE